MTATASGVRSAAEAEPEFTSLARRAMSMGVISGPGVREPAGCKLRRSGVRSAPEAEPEFTSLARRAMSMGVIAGPGVREPAGCKLRRSAVRSAAEAEPEFTSLARRAMSMGIVSAPVSASRLAASCDVQQCAALLKLSRNLHRSPAGRCRWPSPRAYFALQLIPG